MTKLLIESFSYQVVFFLLFISTLLEGYGALKKKASAFSSLLMIGSTALLGLTLVFRGIVYARVPFASLFEFLVMLIFLLLGFGIVIEKKLGQIKGVKLSFLLISLGLMVGVMILEKTPISLLPALQSPWFFSHILSALLAYLAFSVAMIFSVLFLIKKEMYLFSFLMKGIYFGLFMQTLLLVTGSLWALDTWGRFWAWDPKEVWALLTYFVFGSVVHFDFLEKRNRNTLAYLVIFGYLVLLFTFFGVSFGLNGLHAY